MWSAVSTVVHHDLDILLLPLLHHLDHLPPHHHHQHHHRHHHHRRHRHPRHNHHRRHLLHDFTLVELETRAGNWSIDIIQAVSRNVLPLSQNNNSKSSTGSNSRISSNSSGSGNSSNILFTCSSVTQSSLVDVAHQVWHFAPICTASTYRSVATIAQCQHSNDEPGASCAISPIAIACCLSWVYSEFSCLFP